MASRTFATPPDSVLIVRLGAVGDVVRTLPALRALRRSWPESRIAWAVEPGSAPLLAGHPDLDELIVLDRKQVVRAFSRLDLGGMRAAAVFVRTLRAFGPDVAFDFQSSLKSALVARASRAPVRFGFGAGFSREGAHLFVTHRVTPSEPRQHRVLRALTLVEAAGVAPGPVEANLALREDERRVARERLQAIAGTRPRIALGPFSSRRQAWKRYPLASWAEIARGLALGGAHVFVLGGPGEETEMADLCSRAGPFVDPSGAGGLRDLAATIAACDLFVGGDTGPMHLAWASGVPVVALYGPTDPALNAPWGDGHRILAPPVPTARQAPDRFPGITPDSVVRAALLLLASRAASEPARAALGAAEETP